MSSVASLFTIYSPNVPFLQVSCALNSFTYFQEEFASKADVFVSVTHRRDSFEFFSSICFSCVLILIVEVIAQFCYEIQYSKMFVVRSFFWMHIAFL